MFLINVHIIGTDSFSNEVVSLFKKKKKFINNVRRFRQSAKRRDRHEHLFPTPAGRTA